MTDHKIAFVTGASRGIGFEISRQLVERGWKVAMAARGQASLDTAAKGLDPKMVFPVVCDVANQASVDTAFEKAQAHFGAITALVNNAGIIDPIGKIHQTDADKWMDLININIGGVLRMCQAVLPGMIDAGHGVIINLSSGAAHNPIEGWSSYCTSKAGLSMLTRALHAEYGDAGVRVHDFIPGVVATEMLNGAQTKFDNVIARLDENVKLTPDIPARCIAWLVDEGAGEAGKVEQSIRDADLRAKVGLEERNQW